MRIRLLYPALTSTALALLALSADAQAGSFFGPSCYGADYTAQYPNRSHNVFGCGEGCSCRAWHGFFRHRVTCCSCCGQNNGMPITPTPTQGVIVPGMPMEHAQIPLEPSPFLITPVHSTWLAPPPRPPVPVVQPPATTPTETHLIPYPRVLPTSPTLNEPPQLETTGKLPD